MRNLIFKKDGIIKIVLNPTNIRVGKSGRKLSYEGSELFDIIKHQAKAESSKFSLSPQTTSKKEFVLKKVIEVAKESEDTARKLFYIPF
ncbi:MAG: hypothetical protein QE271_05400 [Bacteriovoracaceae bacterium]|nr:hypothetical protein [Bacteriovoracaceae bacterium]